MASQSDLREFIEGIGPGLAADCLKSGPGEALRAFFALQAMIATDAVVSHNLANPVDAARIQERARIFKSLADPEAVKRMLEAATHTGKTRMEPTDG